MESMTSNTELYIKLVEDDELTKKALFACAAALRLDDDVACQAIGLVAGSNGSTDAVLRRIKNLNCVWSQWDGAWYIAEDVRRDLVSQLSDIVPADVLVQLRKLLSSHADCRVQNVSPDGQITSYKARQARLEAAYQRVLTPDQSDVGGAQLAELWEQLPPSAAKAIAESVDYLADEMAERLERLPVEVLFLQGMAARARRDKQGQLRYFGEVWKNGRPGFIFAVAAHLFGNLIRDAAIAEKALRDSIAWNRNEIKKGQVYHSLGNLLARNQKRWDEAEEAYRKSLELRHDPEHKAQVYHSLGNLLAGNAQRWGEAEEAYRKSLELRHDPEDKAQVYHSLGNLFSGNAQRWDEAQEAYRKSVELRHDPEDKGQVYASWADMLVKTGAPAGYTRAVELASKGLKLDPKNPRTGGVCHRVLALAYENLGETKKAIEQLEALKETNRQLGLTKFAAEIDRKIAELRRLGKPSPDQP